MNTSILIVDDETVQREMLGGYLRKKGHIVHLAASGEEALKTVQARTVDIVVSDQKMPGMGGMELAARLHADHPNVSTVIITAYGTIGEAVRAMRDGVEDYLTKPVDLDELDALIERILEKRHLVRENGWLREQVLAAARVPGIIYVSEAMKEVMSRVARAAESRATVLVTGESGTGKELVARAVHTAGERRDKPFVAVNCAAVPETLIESELFGHEKGAFTGAEKTRAGRFEQADGGTLFLDEIGEIPLHVQVKLLRALQERSFERVGGNETIPVDVRIIAATNRNLDEEIHLGRFRQDLFYRLNVVSIAIPPLRTRRADIPVLAEHFLHSYAEEHAKPVTAISPDALDILVKYAFPGNVRELGNIIEQAVVLTRGGTITVRDLPPVVTGQSAPAVPGEMIEGDLDEQVEALERAALDRAMRESGGNKSAAARLIGISERKMRYLLKKYWGEEE